jgi:SIR2-like protein
VPLYPPLVSLSLAIEKANILMPKQGLTKKQLNGILKDTRSSANWALCIGAGTSVPLFPSWDKLVEELISKKDGTKKASYLAKNLLKQFSPDSLIQAAYNILSVSDEEFIRLLSSALFSKIKGKLKSDEWKIFEKVLIADNPASASFDDWKGFEKICDKYFQNCSAYPIAEIIVEARSRGVGPANIISFNAETILFSFLNLFIWKKYAKSHGRSPAQKGQLAKHFDLITHSISNRSSERVPYILCHGILPVSDNNKREKRRLGGLSKLVFAETAYLQLANNSFSWQSSSFLDVCAKRRVVFIGVSLSDPNMRRWLSWLHDNKIQELTSISSKPPKDSTNHFWINKKPTDSTEARWTEAIVSHLGVRLIWLDEWSDLGNTMELMLGIQ